LHGLTRSERLAYTRLRQAAFTDQKLGVTKMLDALVDPPRARAGGHHRKLRDIFEFLEDHGFISCEGWGKVIPRQVTVNEVPPMPSGQDVCARLEHRKLQAESGGTDSDEVDAFICWYAEKWSLFNDGLPHRQRRGEFGMARRLLDRFPQQELRRYVIHWFKYMDQEEFKEHTIRWLAIRIDAIIEHYGQMQASLRDD